MAAKITFDPRKREATLRERGLNFEDAPTVFDGETYTIEDRRVDYGEARFQTVGFLQGRMVMVGRVDATKRVGPCHLDEEVQ